MMKTNIDPPRWIQSLLKRFADEETLEEIEGDMTEFYHQWISRMGRRRADWKYLWTVITLLRPLKKNRKHLSNAPMFIMIRSYFIMSWRTILKNRVASLINISGLTLGLTTSLLILLVVLREFSYDNQHVKRDALFLVMKNQKTNDGIMTGPSTAGPMAETLKSDYAQVSHAARVADFDGVSVIVNGTKSFEDGIYVDPDIFRMMTFPAIEGDPAIALEKNEVVLSRRSAKKLFADRNAIGQLMVVGGSTLTVGAVIEDIAATNTLEFQMAIPFHVFEKDNAWLTKWDDNRIQTWVELHSASDLAGFNREIASLITEKTRDPNENVFAYPLSRLHLYRHFSNGQPSGGMITVIGMLVAFGAFMLLIACVNFMNLATAQAARRAREVGVRKVLGARRRSLVFQFLNESLVITFFSLLAAIGLCALVIPSFNLMMHTSISFEVDRGIVWGLCLSVALVTALVAGSYPAFVLSRFVPARVLKGIIDHPGGLSLRRMLVTSQFVISIFVLVSTIILYAQFDYVQKRPLGYAQEHLIDIPLDSLASARFGVVKNEISKIAGVKSVTGTGGNILYSGGSITGMDWPGRRPDENLSIVIAGVDYDWTQTMGIEITRGRDFNVQVKSDENACLLNQAAVDKMGLTSPVGSVVGGHPVIGVFEDYVYNNPSGVIAPMAVYLTPADIHHLYVSVDNHHSWTTTLDDIRKKIKQLSPDMSFSAHFVTDQYQGMFKEVSDVALMVSVFGGMTIFISCLGLFGLSGFVAERRSKEMSIRKVFGADNVRVLWSLSTDILKPVVAALLIVIPLSVWVGGMMLDIFVYRVSLQWWMFAQATIIVLAVAFIVVLYHAWRTASESPSLRLKAE